MSVTSTTSRVDVYYCGTWTKSDVLRAFLKAIGYTTIIMFLLIAFLDPSLMPGLSDAPMFAQLNTCDFRIFGLFFSNKCMAKNMIDVFYFFLGVWWALIDGTSGAHRTMMRARSDAAWQGQGPWAKVYFFFNDVDYEAWLIFYWFMLVVAIQGDNLAFIYCIMGGWLLGRIVSTAGQLWVPSLFKPTESPYRPVATNDGVQP